MDGTILQLMTDPAVVIFLLCTLVAAVGRFLKSWIISCVLLLLFGLLVIFVIVTAGQFLGLENQIRFYITAQYSFFSSFTLTLREIILTVVIVIAFQIALALHVTRTDINFQKRFFSLPRRHCCHYEMEYTLSSLAQRFKRKK
ncbi:MAG: hypothetical protein LUQ07_03660 [Methanospirillum sp.]|nr:hypothetical protein [Methanospirillum sp.]